MEYRKYKQSLLVELKGNFPQKSIQLGGAFCGGLLVKLYDFVTHNYINEYVRLLRRTEFFYGKHNIAKIFYYYSLWRLKKISVLSGINIPINVCIEGLTLYHYGSIVVNGNSRIGKNVCIMNNVNIGSNKGEKTAPVIGDNVYIGPGAVVYGDIRIADNVYIGANSVVNKSVEVPFSVVAGVPASLIKIEKYNWWQYNGLSRD